MENGKAENDYLLIIANSPHITQRHMLFLVSKLTQRNLYDSEFEMALEENKGFEKVNSIMKLLKETNNINKDKYIKDFSSKNATDLLINFFEGKITPNEDFTMKDQDNMVNFIVNNIKTFDGAKQYLAKLLETKKLSSENEKIIKNAHSEITDIFRLN
jgi:hypothetical protein